ncbi:MAG: response regulator [Acidobacteriota bacterium]
MDRTLLIGCPACGRRYRFDAQRFGTTGIRIRCRFCQEIMRVEISQEETTGSGPDSPAPEPGQPGPFSAAPDPVEAEPGALVADSEGSVRSTVSETLRASGYLVDEVENGVEVRRFVAVHRPQVVFLNVFLPHVLGVTLCSEIKRHPELSKTRVILVGSLYRRDRFMRDPRDLYGADGFLDANGSPEEVRQRVRDLAETLKPVTGPGEMDGSGDALEELRRLARIVAGDIILYNPERAEEEIASGRFFDTFAEEIREGEALVNRRFPDIADGGSLYHETLREAVVQHSAAAGIPSPVGR